MKKFSEISKVRTSDANFQAQIKLPSLLEFLQEAATNHADMIGLGRSEIYPKKLGWALTKLHLKIDKLPLWQDLVEVITWPSCHSKIVAEREFLLKDSKSNIVIAKARTQWVLINLQTRKLERISALGTSWDENPEKSFEEDVRNNIEISRVDFSAHCTVRKEDIDLNLHVNNAVYLTWALEAVPNAFMQINAPKELSISFISEVSQGNSIISECQFEGSKSIHSIKLADTLKECARVNIDWEKI